jgi:glycine/D-amino acid oxidase-like deaminating enzyme
MLSFWESHQLNNNDFSIVGGGILGLFTALELSNKFPNSKIVVYERDSFAAGATSKNAGFACFGSISEILSDRILWGDSISLEIIHKRWLGIERIQKLLGSKIDYENYGGYELFFDNTCANENLEKANQFLHPIFKTAVFSNQSEKIKEFGFGTQVKKLAYNPLEGQIHSGKLIYALHELLNKKNIRIQTNSEVTEYSSGNKVEFLVNNKWTVKTNQLIFCTNAFPPLGINNIKPGRGQVLITKPIPNLKFKGCFHFQDGYYYFRNVGDRILFGGGRQLDFEGETGNSFLLNEKIQQDLDEKLQTIISPNQNIEIDNRWSGIMAFSENKLPLVEHISKNVIYAMNCNGMGVSLSPMTAIDISDLF